MIQVLDNYILVSVGMFTVKQSKSRKTGKYGAPTINHTTGAPYDINGLLLHEFDLMKAKNIARILLMHHMKQETKDAYTIDRVVSQVKAVLGEY